MAKLVWNQAGERFYETGVDRGVLYIPNQAGVAWNGLVAVTESPSGGDVTSYYADNSQYVNRAGLDKFGGTIEAFTYPEEFEACDGSLSLAGVTVGQQNRKSFGFSYRTNVGNDLVGSNYGYKIHLVYNATAKASDVAYSTINESPETVPFSWEFATTPVNPFSATVGRNTYKLKPFSHVIINSHKTDSDLMNRIENYLYGTKTMAPKLFTLSDLIYLYNSPLASLLIDANPKTGLSPIRDTYSAEGDLLGNTAEGLYSSASKTRLIETSVPGLYTLE